MFCRRKQKGILSKLFPRKKIRIFGFPIISAGKKKGIGSGLQALGSGGNNIVINNTFVIVANNRDKKEIIQPLKKDKKPAKEISKPARKLNKKDK